MSEILLVNPRRRRKKKGTRKKVSRRRRRNPVAANPIRRRRRRRNPARRTRRSRRRRNPVGFKRSAIEGQVKNSVSGALGALGLDIALAYLPLPAQLKGGIVGKVTKGLGAIALGVVANRFMKVNAVTAQRLTEGALTVQFHGIGRELLTQFAPNVALSAYLNDEFDSTLGYAGSGWNPNAPLTWGAEEDTTGMSAYLNAGYDTANFDSSQV